jgi:hypothetical protein
LGTKNFQSVDLGDRRRTERLITSAAQIAAHPQKPFNQVFDWNDLRAFYRLCHLEQATLPALQEPHWQLTRSQMAPHPLVLILHDTTEMNFTSHQALQGTGPLGTGEGRGFLQHNSLAILPQPKEVLGLAYQQLYRRRQAPKKESTIQRQSRKRESQLWMQGIEAIGRPPQGCSWVDVGDRGADIYEAMLASQNQGHDFLFRVTQNRAVWLDPEQEKLTKLREYVCSLASQGHDTVEIPARGGRPAREAIVQFASSAVWVPAPWGTPKRFEQPVVAAWVVRIWETNPPEGVEALEWILITSVESETLEQMKQRRDWYACRWMIEVFHDIQKNGCSEEDRRFQTASRMSACLAILSVVAVRIFQMRTALESHPEASAEQIATREEIEVLGCYLGVPESPWTVREFVRGVARLGGFLGRKNDGEPGVKTLWRGYQRLQDLLLGYQFRTSPPKKNVGNR